MNEVMEAVTTRHEVCIYTSSSDTMFTPVWFIFELSFSKIGGVKLNIIELFYNKVSSPLFERAVFVFAEILLAEYFVALGIIVIFIEFKIIQKCQPCAFSQRFYARIFGWY